MSWFSSLGLIVACVILAVSGDIWLTAPLEESGEQIGEIIIDLPGPEDDMLDLSDEESGEIADRNEEWEFRERPVYGIGGLDREPRGRPLYIRGTTGDIKVKGGFEKRYIRHVPGMKERHRRARWGPSTRRRLNSDLGLPGWPSQYKIGR